MAFVLTVLVVFALLCVNELWWRRRTVHDEVSRKFIHITVGTFVAFWPFLLTWNQIRLLSVAFLLVVLISKYFHLFRAIHSVKRPTWGEIFFALAVGGVTFITDNKWIYLAAILQMSLADGLAAIIGVAYGKKRRYLILGQTKSMVGTATFAVVSMLILIGFMYADGTPLSVLVIVGTALLASVVENIGVYGTDNLIVPLFVAATLAMIAS